MNVGILTLLDHYFPEAKLNKLEDDIFIGGIVLMVTAQVVHVIVLVSASIKLAKQLLHHTAPTGFLLQSYLSTIILFAGVYTLIHRANASAWTATSAGSENEDLYIIKSFVIFVYVSVQTITSVGYGDVHPRVWYAYLLVSLQMLVGVMYSVAILGRGLEVLGSTRRFRSKYTATAGTWNLGRTPNTPAEIGSHDTKTTSQTMEAARWVNQAKSPSINL